VNVSALNPFVRNPRRIRENAYKRLQKSLSESGYHQRIIATKDLRVIGGHQRIKALKELGLKQVPVLVPDVNLSEDQFRRLFIQDNLPFGEWNFDILSSDFSIQELTGLRMPEKWLGLGEQEEPGTCSTGECEADDASRVVPCPKCGHEFSILAEKKAKKR
jgi:hypothetical protein